MACKGCIKIKSYLKLNKKSKFSINYEVDGNDENEIKRGIKKLRRIQNELKDDAEKSEIIEKPEEGKDIGEKERGKLDLVNKYKIIILASMADMVRLFESLFEAAMISPTTTIMQIAEMFFSELPEQIKFTNKYYSTKNRIKKDESSSNGENVVLFMERFAEKSLKNKGEELDHLINFLLELRKKAR